MATKPDMLYVGLDDTDMPGTAGAGHKARELAALIEARGYGLVHSISRHQFLRHPAIAYTSQNSSACLAISSPRREEVRRLCTDYLLEQCPPGSDPGLCLFEGIPPPSLIAWALQAKNKVLSKEGALSFGSLPGMELRGLGGDNSGIIGALAGAALRSTGIDGRFIYLKNEKNIRDLQGIYLIRSVKQLTGIGLMLALDGRPVSDAQRIMLGAWTRPLLRDGRIVLLCRRAASGQDYEWETADKDFVRHF